MNYGPLIFLAAFFGLSVSWFGFVLTPQIQIGRAQPETTAAGLYPQGKPGVARQGEQVYRANGCYYCHSQQVGQSGTMVELVLADMGTNPVAVAEAWVAANPGMQRISAPALAAGLPKTLARGTDMAYAHGISGKLEAAGAKAEVHVVPVGPDIDWHWGSRRTVAEDYLFDSPAMPGSQRVGPDLANIGLRLPDLNWQLVHLYAPRAAQKDSAMPRYKFLFEQQKIGRDPSPDALKLPSEFAPPAGFEIVPKPEAKQLAAYLVSLGANAPLFEAPMTVASAPAAASTTNSPPK